MDFAVAFLQHCTLTGADDKVSISELRRLTKEYPFVEWGILRKGDVAPRYPSDEWILSLWNSQHAQPIAFHMCGYIMKEYLRHHGMNMFSDPLYFVKPQRIQLNFNAIKSNMEPSYFGFDCNHKIILQLNKANASFISKIIQPHDFHLLYDSSGGRGTRIATINSPVPGYFTGYAGGITPDNVEEILEKIVESIGGFGRYWIDMESGIRTNDEFDLSKAEKVLEIAKKYAKL